jgi:hypothetical protein
MDKLHRCHGNLPTGWWGAAVTDCWEETSGELWVSNDEYASCVNYCPFCGFEAKTAVYKKPFDFDKEIVVGDKVLYGGCVRNISGVYASADGETYYTVGEDPRARHRYDIVLLKAG